VACRVNLQLAKLAGAHVTATCGARNIEFVKSLGADEVLDYRTPEGQALKSPAGVKYDVLLDGTPNGTWKVVGPVLTPAGECSTVQGCTIMTALPCALWCQPYCTVLCTTLCTVLQGALLYLLHPVVPCTLLYCAGWFLLLLVLF